MENLSYLFAAYTIIFAVIFFYVLFLWRRQARLDAELRSLESRLRGVREELASRLSQASRSTGREAQASRSSR
jgi:CcmD family protein